MTLDTVQPTPNSLVIDQIRAHHTELASRLHELSWTVLTAAKHATNRGDWVVDRDALHTWYRDELLPHIVAEEQALYSVASELDATRLLICSMLTEHRSLVSLLADLALAREPFEAAVIAATAQALLTGHLGKENDLLLPALGTLGVELAVLLDGKHDLLGYLQTQASARRSWSARDPQGRRAGSRGRPGPRELGVPPDVKRTPIRHADPRPPDHRPGGRR